MNEQLVRQRLENIERLLVRLLRTQEMPTKRRRAKTKTGVTAGEGKRICCLQEFFQANY